MARLRPGALPPAAAMRRALSSSSSAAASAPIADYTPWLSPQALRRRPSPIRALQPLVNLPGMISLGGGMPHPGTFPFTGVALTLRGGEVLQASAADTREALQYSPTPGLPELVSRLTALQAAEHAPPRPVAVAVMPGSQDGLAKAFDALLSEGDAVLVEAPTYSGACVSK